MFKVRLELHLTKIIKNKTFQKQAERFDLDFVRSFNHS
jgi:hypothetical protein